MGFLMFSRRIKTMGFLMFSRRIEREHWALRRAPPSKTPPPSFFAKPLPPPLNLETVQARLLRQFPLYIVFLGIPPRNRIIQ